MSEWINTCEFRIEMWQGQMHNNSNEHRQSIPFSSQNKMNETATAFIHSSPPFPYLITDALPGHIDGRAHDLGLSGRHGSVGNVRHAECRGDGCPGIHGKAAASRCDAAFWMTIKRESCHEEKKRGEQEKCADKSYGGTSLRECIIPIQSWKESMMSSIADTSKGGVQTT